MVRRTPTPDIQDASPPHASAQSPSDILAAFAPFVAAWYASAARTVALFQQAEAARGVALAALASSMRDIAALAEAARNQQDWTAVGARVQEAWMEFGRTRQEDLAHGWAEMRGEGIRQMQSFADRNAMATTGGQVEGGPADSSVAALMDQARESMSQWTRDWMAVARSPEAVQ